MTESEFKKSKSPFKALLDIKKEEWPLALLMFGYFFLVITTFWILKPIKKSIFIRFYDERGVDLWGWHLDAAQAELIAKVLNMGVAFVAVVVFTVLSRKLRRQQLSFVFTGFYVATLAVYSFLLDNLNHTLVWSFYLYGDLYSTLMVATFFAFLNDSVTPASAKRLYGLVVLGGVAGGAFGATFVRGWVDTFDNATWMWICVGTSVAILGLAAYAGRKVTHSDLEMVKKEPDEAAESTQQEKEEKKAEKNPALEGAQLVFRSGYLLSIVGIVGIYEIVSTVLDFQFTATVAHYLDGKDIDSHFATVYALTNILALIVQLFATNAILNNFRLRVALLVTPVVIMATSGAFLAVPALWFGSFLSTSDNAFNYSINQSAREALYTPTSRDEKYKAKAFIDMFVQRFAKALAVGVSLVITTVFADFSTVRWLSLFTLGMVAVWGFAALYAGKHFTAQTDERAEVEEETPESFKQPAST